MNPTEYLKSNFCAYSGQPLSDEQAKQYAQQIVAKVGEPNSKREIDEIVMFQEWYKITLPIYNKHLI
jgi:hypothetical protein